MSKQQHTSKTEELTSKTAVSPSSSTPKTSVQIREQKAFELSKQFARLSDITSLAVYTVQQLENVFSYYQVDLFLHDHAFTYSWPQLQQTKEDLLIDFARAGKIVDVSTEKSISFTEPDNLVAAAAQAQKIIIANKLAENKAFVTDKNLSESQSEVAIPLLDDHQLLGILDLHHTECDHFDLQELRILQIITSQLAIALAKAELFAQNQQIQERQRIITETAESLLSIHRLEELWATLVTAIRQALNGDRAAIYLLDEQTDLIYCPYADNISQTYIEHLYKHHQSAPGRAAFTQRTPIIINNIHTDPSTETLRPYMIEEGFQAYAVLPFVSPDEEHVQGFVVVYRDQLRPFSAEDVSSILTITHIGAVAMHNIKLLQETQHNLRREEQLNRITHTLSSVLDLPTILGNVIRLSTRLIGADAGLLGLIIDGQIMTFYPYNIPDTISLRPTKRGRGLAWLIVDSEHPVHLTDYPKSKHAQSRWIEAGVTNFIGVPLATLDENLGSLMLFNLDQKPRQFSKRDIDLLEAIGRQAATAIQNARMYAEAQQRANALIQTLNRQAELDDLKNKFIQTVSHELRTPLGIIYGHADLVNQSLGENLDPMQKQSIEIIGRRAKMLTDLVEDLTALLAAETQELRREDINTTDFAYSLIADYQINALEKEVHLKHKIANPLPMIKGDLTQLRRVFDNLVSNALKFTPKEGTITIHVWAESENVMIEVADTGTGIPNDKLGRIFERFYQVDSGSKRKYGGTGLGLALVREIVEAHRGHVSVQSEVGKGTAFTILIPGYWP